MKEKSEYEWGKCNSQTGMRDGDRWGNLMWKDDNWIVPEKAYCHKCKSMSNKQECSARKYVDFVLGDEYNKPCREINIDGCCFDYKESSK